MREADLDFGAMADSAANLEQSSVAFHNLLDDGEPEPGPAAVAAAGGIDPIEALGQPRKMFRRNSVAMIAYMHT